MLKAYVRATVWNTCYLSEDDEQKIRQYAEENDTSLEEATEALYNQGEIHLYSDAEESDFSTEEVEDVEEIED